MAHRSTLNEKQLTLLRWVADGCPEGVMDGYSHRISVAALRSRGLVRTAGRGPTWRASVTAAGRENLARAAGPEAPVPRQANASVTQQLVDDVIAAGGSLRVPAKPYYRREGIDYARRAQLAERHGKVSEGKRLEAKWVSGEELRIDLVDAPEGTVIPLAPVPVPARVSRYHPVVREFKERSERHEVSRGALPRVLRILQGLVVEAERRGHRSEIAPSVDRSGYGRPTWTSARDGHLVITADGCPGVVRVSEEGLPGRAHWERTSRSYTYRPGGGFTSRTPPLAEYEENATGRITLELVPNYSRRGRPASWSDRRSWTLEDKLRELLREIEVRAAEHRHHEREAERRAAERERAWEAAMERARERYAEARRAEALRGEVARWREAEEIRAYCNAAESAYPDDPATGGWVSWARRRADELDPLGAAPKMPPAPAPESVSPDDLRPYLDGRNPYGPDRRGW